MHPPELVDRYLEAWTAADSDAVLELLHDGATYYDAFWMEYCTGRDLRQYLADTFAEEQYRYWRDGAVITVDDGIAFRYIAAERGTEAGPEVYRGAEVFDMHGEKILTISDFYCMPHDAALLEVAHLVKRRHGSTRYARAGLGSSTVSRFRSKLSALLDSDILHLDPNLTLSELADRIGCTVAQLTEVIRSEFGTSFDGLLDRQRAAFARDLLTAGPTDANALPAVARQAGFRSLEQLNSSFLEAFGLTPLEYLRHGVRGENDAAN